MKILLCSHTGFFRGGSERSLLYLAESMKGHHLNFVINIPDDSKELSNEFEKKNLKFICIHKDSNKQSLNKISFLQKVIKIFIRLIYIFKIYHFIKSNQIDVVYLNTLRTTSEYIAARIAGIRTVMHIRGFDTRSDIRFKVLSKLDKIITLNPEAKNVILNKKPNYNSNNVLVIPNGVLIQSLNKKKNSKIVKIVWIGGYEFTKGVDYQLEIADKLLSQFSNIQIIHIGDSSPKDDFSKFQFKKYVHLFRNKKFIELGFIDNVSEVICGCDIFLMTSRNEGMPRSLLESMERGLIPIVSKLPELMNVIREGENGFFIDLMDMDKSLDKIKMIIKNISNYQEVSLMARKDVVNKYDLANTNQRIINALTNWSG